MTTAQADILVSFVTKLKRAGVTEFSLGDFAVSFGVPEAIDATNALPPLKPDAKPGMVTFADIESGKYFE